MVLLALALIAQAAVAPAVDTRPPEIGAVTFRGIPGGLVAETTLRDESGIFAPLLFFRSGPGPFTGVPLVRKGEHYQAALPAVPPIEWFAEAWDTVGNGPARVGSVEHPRRHPEGAAPSAPPAAPTSGRTVAVLEFENQLGPEEKKLDRVYFSDAVRAALADPAAGLVVMTRENVLQLLVASGKKLEECVGECEVETGRLLGAELVVSGRLTRVGKRYKLTLRVHDTRRGALLGSTSASGESVEALDDDTARAARGLLPALR